MTDALTVLREDSETVLRFVSKVSCPDHVADAADRIKDVIARLEREQAEERTTMAELEALADRWREYADEPHLLGHSRPVRYDDLKRAIRAIESTIRLECENTELRAKLAELERAERLERERNP